jgi:hypothetical protein
MKRPRVRFFIEGKKSFTRRNERVFGEVNAGFIKIIEGKKKYERFKISLEERIDADDFGYQHENYKYSPTVLNKYVNRTGDNALMQKINRFENLVIEVYNYFLSQNQTPTASRFKHEVLIRLGRFEREVHVSKPVYIKDVIDGVISDEEKMLNSSVNKKSENTLKVYRTVSGYLARYEKVKGTRLKLNEFTKDTYLDFWRVQDDILKGVIKVKIDGKKEIVTSPYGFLSSSVNKYQKAMITLFKRGKVEPPLDLTDKSLIARKVSNKKDFYLNMSELKLIIESKPMNEKDVWSKHYIIIASLTGMRYESMSEAGGKSIKEYVIGDKNFFYLESKQNKTKTEAFIPLFKPVLDVLGEYGNRFPKFPSNPKMNKYIKDYLSNIGINRKIELKIVPYIDASFSEIRPISDMFATHDCRKTAYTLLATHGVKESTIDLITHPSSKRGKMSNIYNRATLLDNAVKFYREVEERQPKLEEEVFSFQTNS